MFSLPNNQCPTTPNPPTPTQAVPPQGLCQPAFSKENIAATREQFFSKLASLPSSNTTSYSPATGKGHVLYETAWNLAENEHGYLCTKRLVNWHDHIHCRVEGVELDSFNVFSRFLKVICDWTEIMDEFQFNFLTNVEYL